MWILIRWLHQKSADLDLQCFPQRIISWFSQTRVKTVSSLPLLQQTKWKRKTSECVYKIRDHSHIERFHLGIFIPIGLLHGEASASELFIFLQFQFVLRSELCKTYINMIKLFL